MNDITQILNAIDAGDPHGADQLLPLVYDELRKLAAAKMVAEKPGQTLNATALVHEAYLRLVGEKKFANRRHFFASAAEAMRRILVDRARERNSLKRGGGMRRADLHESDLVAPEDSSDLIAIDDALANLGASDPQAAELVKLRYFAGLTPQQTADVMGISLRTAERTWAYARTWLFNKLKD